MHPNLVPTDDWYLKLVSAVRSFHEGERDRVGRPWAFHFERVALRAIFRNPSAPRPLIEAALLHDAFMVPKMGLPMLKRLGLSEEAIKIVEVTTPPPNADYYRDFENSTPRDAELYLDYIRGLAASGNRNAIEMKLADAIDTIELCRLGGSDILIRQWKTRYGPSQDCLEAALQARSN
jgi:hypothetical protein